MRILLLLIVTLALSCASDSSQGSATSGTSKAAETSKANAKKPGRTAADAVSEFSDGQPRATVGKSIKQGKVSTNFNKHGIPDACDLLTQETIGKWIGIPSASISLADGSSSRHDKQRACFFKWDVGNIPNAGVMVQVQQNQVADDVPEYLTYMIASLKTDGENDFNGGRVMKYQDWPDFGDDGAYSTEAGKYMWRVGNDWAFQIAFNTELSDKEQKKAAYAFAKEVMSRMTF